MKSLIFFTAFALFFSWVLCKDCTNTVYPSLSSHTLRYEFEVSNNETLKKEVFSHYHLTPTDDSAWSSLFPRKMLKEQDEHSWTMMYRSIKNLGGVKGIGGVLSEISLHDVRLDSNSIHGLAQKTNLDYLLMLDVDSLVWSFRKTAGFETVGKAYGGWEAPNVELRGHFVGHYLSASAQMWASTDDEKLKQKMTAVVSVLSACQQKMGTGYLSAFPSELFDRFEAVQYAWAPYYTIHKILAGLLDQYTLGGNDQALKMTTWMVDYFYNRVQNVITKYSIERHWMSLNEETGGMNDVLYRLYSITGNEKHLVLAHLFDKPCFLGLLAMKADDISGFHANTHIPVVIGSQMRYEVTGDPLYKEIGTFFMDIVNSSHSFATGGTSVSEFWHDPKRLASSLSTENEESCTTYNMLKISRNLFRWTKEIAYADYYERALTNGVLGIQRGTDPGIMIYMLPMVRGGSKALSYHGWGTKYDSFWCCYGTGVESFSKLGDSIYFEEGGNSPSLYVIQYIPSSINWRLGHISLDQEVEQVVSWDPRLQVTFTITSKEQAASSSILNFRIPQWTNSNGAKASLNGQNIPLATPGNFHRVERNWNLGDKITLEMPMSLRTESIKDDRAEYSSLKAIFYGPYLLAGFSNGDWDLNAKSETFSDWIAPIPSDYNSRLVSFTQEIDDATIFSLTNSNQSMKMENSAQPGTNLALMSTFRLILKDETSRNFSGPEEAIGKSVMLEPVSFPGKLIVHNGEGQNLGVADSSDTGNSVFRLVSGLDGKADSVSLESEGKSGCYIYSGMSYKAGTRANLVCDSKSDDEGYKKAVSFTLRKGFSEYHPISFVAKGVGRNFLLSPLFSIRDESYTVYFKFQA